MSTPVAVIIPTWNRGDAVLTTLRRIAQCDPLPAEIWLHVDASDGGLETTLARDFPHVRVLSSTGRIGPGGGRHLCLRACTTPYAVSFDDDSWPVDDDFFAVAAGLLDAESGAAIIAATIRDRDQVLPPRSERLAPTVTYHGCGHAIRVAAYGQTRGYLPLPVAYGMEESDLALQLFAAGWTLRESGALRVRHDTDGAHRTAPEIAAGHVSNTALFAFLHYPVALWGLAVLQVLNQIAFRLRNGQGAGVLRGLMQMPRTFCTHRIWRRPLPFMMVVNFMKLRRAGIH